MARGIKTGGRTKGVQNKISAELKEMVIGALHDAGGQAYFTEQARVNPAAFMKLLGRLLAKNMNATAEGNTGIAARICMTRDRRDRYHDPPG